MDHTIRRPEAGSVYLVYSYGLVHKSQRASAPILQLYVR
ncbi:hypothetical protein RSAG8_08382, partial [Rhizoctonia solani AG-8 WAC10335]